MEGYRRRGEVFFFFREVAVLYLPTTPREDEIQILNFFARVTCKRSLEKVHFLCSCGIYM